MSINKTAIKAKYNSNNYDITHRRSLVIKCIIAYMSFVSVMTIGHFFTLTWDPTNKQPTVKMKMHQQGFV